MRTRYGNLEFRRGVRNQAAERKLFSVWLDLPQTPRDEGANYGAIQSRDVISISGRISLHNEKLILQKTYGGGAIASVDRAICTSLIRVMVYDFMSPTPFFVLDFQRYQTGNFILCIWLLFFFKS